MSESAIWIALAITAVIGGCCLSARDALRGGERFTWDGRIGFVLMGVGWFLLIVGLK